jgi:uncharacterized membrane protein
MPPRAIQLAGALLVLVLLGMPLAAHIALVTNRAVALAGILITVQAVLVTWIVSSAITQRIVRVGACVAVLLSVCVLTRFTDHGTYFASAVPHAMAYLALLAIFAASLGAGREAVVTTFARRSRGALSPEIVRYTRRVTWAWCWFFLAQLLASLLLLLFASPEVWSAFINLCNLPLIAVMFCAEYLYRRWQHAGRTPERLLDMLRVVRQIRPVPTAEDRYRH